MYFYTRGVIAMLKRISIILVLLTLVVPVHYSTAISAQNNYEHITAHRGSSGTAPENTLSAVLHAINHGAGYAEIDVQLSADGVIVLYHDQTLVKLGNGKNVTELPYVEIAAADAGGWFSSDYIGERIPTLLEVLDAARDRIKLNIELKLYTPDSPLPEAVAALLESSDFIAHCIVTSFDRSAIQRVKSLNPNIKTGLIVRNKSALTTQFWSSDIDVLSVKSKLINRSLVKKATKNGKELHVWTVNTEKEMRKMLGYNVKSIITDYPELLYNMSRYR
jgi:glycerophosphoryl diester phosphodiesterase